MELLPSGQANTSTEVTYEDQLKINKFSTLISKKDEQTQQLSTLKTEKEYLDDLSIELELIDDDGKIQYKVGDCFVFLPKDQVLEKIESDADSLEEKINSIEELIDGFDEELKDLKAQLYDKFGDNINLER
ncbi:prefoldin subunit 4 [Candida albicans P94015]|nr:prefoldin subunit 4 [Candida albicans P94015]